MTTIESSCAQWIARCHKEGARTAAPFIWACSNDESGHGDLIGGNRGVIDHQRHPPIL